MSLATAASKLRKPGRLITVSLLALSAVGAVAQPAAAANTYNIMIIGKDIPAGVGSVEMKISDRDPVCVRNLQSGVDRNTGLSIGSGQLFSYKLGQDSACQALSSGVWWGWAPSDNGGLKNWWLSLK